MIRKINGSFIEFHHVNKKEGTLYNDAIHAFTEAQWREKIDEMHALGMRYVVILATASYGNEDDENECYYDSAYYRKSDVVRCSDPIEAILDEADKLNMLVFLGVGFYSNYHRPWETMQREEAYVRAFRAIDELHAKYSSHVSLYGWYLSDECGINGYLEEFFITYVNRYDEKIKSLNPAYKLLIAPYGTKNIVADDTYISQLKRLHVDFIAYQDEVGVRKATPEQTKEYFRNLKAAHDAAGMSRLWADVETFSFADKVYQSSLLPAPIDRIREQLESVSPYVDEILIYEYLCTMNKENTTAFCGVKESYQLYRDYANLN